MLPPELVPGIRRAIEEAEEAADEYARKARSEGSEPTAGAVAEQISASALRAFAARLEAQLGSGLSDDDATPVKRPSAGLVRKTRPPADEP